MAEARSVSAVIGRPLIPREDVFHLPGVSFVEGHVDGALIPGIGPFGIHQEEVPFPLFHAISEEGECINARLVEGVFETPTVEGGHRVPKFESPFLNHPLPLGPYCPSTSPGKGARLDQVEGDGVDFLSAKGNSKGLLEGREDTFLGGRLRRVRGVEQGREGEEGK